MTESLGVSESVTVEVVRANPLSALPPVALPSTVGFELSGSLIIAIVGIIVGITFAYLGMRKYKINTAQYSGYNRGLWGGQKYYQKHFDKNRKVSLKKESKTDFSKNLKKKVDSEKLPSMELKAPSFSSKSITIPDMQKGEIAAPAPPMHSTGPDLPLKKFFTSILVSGVVGLTTFVFSGSEFSWFLAIGVFYYRFFVK